ncbi:MAG: hypothetical protein WBQ21_09845, partial [Solirubrobacteraceae bacterium]
TVPEAQPVVPEPVSPNPVATAATVPAPMPVDTSAAPAPNPVPNMNPAEADNDLTPRIVSHEGTVRAVGSIIAPTAYVLYNRNTMENIDFLYSTSTNLDLSRYEGYQIVATGQEGLAKRWNETPVLTVQSILVVSTNVYTAPRVLSPRASQRH